jgi:hypothetical protein
MVIVKYKLISKIIRLVLTDYRKNVLLKIIKFGKSRTHEILEEYRRRFPLWTVKGKFFVRLLTSDQQRKTMSGNL